MSQRWSTVRTGGKNATSEPNQCRRYDTTTKQENPGWSHKVNPGTLAYEPSAPTELRPHGTQASQSGKKSNPGKVMTAASAQRHYLGAGERGTPPDDLRQKLRVVVSRAGRRSKAVDETHLIHAEHYKIMVAC